jgi:hypothetical protein
VRGERFLLSPFAQRIIFASGSLPGGRRFRQEPRPARRELSKPVLKN